MPDTNDFVAGLRELLSPEGRAVLEFPYAVDMIAQGEFDTIYHEHVFYFTITALEPLFARTDCGSPSGAHLVAWGSLRIFVRRNVRGGFRDRTARDRDISRSEYGGFL